MTVHESIHGMKSRRYSQATKEFEAEDRIRLVPAKLLSGIGIWWWVNRQRELYDIVTIGFMRAFLLRLITPDAREIRRK